MNSIGTVALRSWHSLVSGALLASLTAGDAIMQIYSSRFEVYHKNDQSPLTEADKQSHEVLASQLDGSIPLLSEEGRSISYEERREWNYFWLIDPLDGTKEFIKRNGEFTVNVALMDRNSPIVGIVYLPAKGRIFWGGKGLGAFQTNDAGISIIREAGNGNPDRALELALDRSTPLRVPDSDEVFGRMKVVQSVSHVSQEEEDFISRLKTAVGEIETLNAGSSLKFCQVAEGNVDLYPRLGPTMEWDTAAGQCIAAAAGCEVIDIASGAPILYNKRVPKNGPFVVFGSRFKAKTQWREAVLACARSCVPAAADKPRG